MLIQLIRNRPKGQAITGRLVIDGRWFCDTLERVGYQIPALCYPIKVTQSPKFKRLLPLVCNVPQRSGIRFHRGSQPKHSTGCILTLGDNKIKTNYASEGYIIENNLNVREAIVRGVCRDKNLRGNQLPAALEVNNSQASNNNIGSRSSADVEQALTSLILKAQNNHETIILEVTDYRLGTELGYNTPCDTILQEHKRNARCAEQRYLELHPEERKR